MSDLIRQTSDEILRLMNRKGVSQRSLADRLGVTEAAVCQMLSNRNLTLRSVERIFQALDTAPMITVLPF